MQHALLLKLLHLYCQGKFQEYYIFFFFYSIMTYGVIHYVQIRKLGIWCCFYFLYFVGFVTKCIYDTIILFLFHICTKTSCMCYRFWMTLYRSTECIMNEWMIICIYCYEQIVCNSY
jgi:hypothetical protein